MWHEPPDWVVGSATGVPSLRVWDDAITPEQIQEEWTAWNGTDWIYVSLLVLDGEDGRYTWQEQARLHGMCILPLHVAGAGGGACRM